MTNTPVRLLTVSLCALAAVIGAAPSGSTDVKVAVAAADVQVTLANLSPVNHIEPTFASFNIDPSCNRGFHFTNFANPNLAAAATGLFPAVMRFGGSGADELVYGLDGGSECSGIPPPSTTGCSYFNPGCLNATHFEGLHSLATTSGAQFLFGLSFDLITACEQGPRYEWNTSAAVRLLDYLSNKGYTLWGFELGNEVNNDGGSPCNLTAPQQAAAFVKFAALLRSRASNSRLVGPDTGGRAPEAWLRALLPLLPKDMLHAVTHHVYPGYSRSNFNSPAKLNSTLPEIAWYTAVVSELGSGAQVWAGENGPTGGGDDGTCGPDSVCGTFASTVYYADDMALRARNGFVHYQRQDLFGGAYGLLSSLTGAMALGAADAVAIHPDFWTAFLWKRTLGTAVLAPASSDPGVRAYAFSGAPPSPFAAPACSLLSLLLINLSNSSSVHVGLPVAPAGASGMTSLWALTSGDGDPFGTTAALNGVVLPSTVDMAHTDPKTFLQAITVPPVRADVGIGATLPPLATGFICYEQ